MPNKAEKIATLVEKSLRKDLNASSSLPYTILPPEGEGLPQHSQLAGMLNGHVQVHETRFGGVVQQTKDISPFCYVYFDLDRPRPFALQAFIWNPGLVTYIHRLAYAVPLTIPVRGPVHISDPNVAIFSGDSGAASRLNSNPQLLKLADTIAVTERRESFSESYPLLIDRCLGIYPHEAGSLFIVHTLPKTLMMRQTLFANEVLQLASLIEATLS